MPSTAVNAESMSSLEWSVAVLQPYIRVGVVARPTDYNRSWQNGVALLCLVHLVDASLVPDMDAIVRWLGTSSLAPDHDEHIRVLKSLKVVYSASVDTWMQTCQRALAIANKLVGVSLSHNDLAQLKCSQEEVIQLIEAFRRRIGDRFDSTTTTSVAREIMLPAKATAEPVSTVVENTTTNNGIAGSTTTATTRTTTSYTLGSNSSNGIASKSILSEELVDTLPRASPFPVPETSATATTTSSEDVRKSAGFGAIKSFFEVFGANGGSSSGAPTEKTVVTTTTAVNQGDRSQAESIVTKDVVVTEDPQLVVSAENVATAVVTVRRDEAENAFSQAASEYPVSPAIRTAIVERVTDNETAVTDPMIVEEITTITTAPNSSFLDTLVDAVSSVIDPTYVKPEPTVTTTKTRRISQNELNWKPRTTSLKDENVGSTDLKSTTTVSTVTETRKTVSPTMAQTPFALESVSSREITDLPPPPSHPPPSRPSLTLTTDKPHLFTSPRAPPPTPATPTAATGSFAPRLLSGSRAPPPSPAVFEGPAKPFDLASVKERMERVIEVVPGVKEVVTTTVVKEKPAGEKQAVTTTTVVEETPVTMREVISTTTVVDETSTSKHGISSTGQRPTVLKEETNFVAETPTTTDSGTKTITTTTTTTTETASQPLVATTQQKKTKRHAKFTWTSPAGAPAPQSVQLAGNFNSWIPVPMPQSVDAAMGETHYSTVVDMASFAVGDKVAFKFVVDGEWVTSPAFPVEQDEKGNENNVIVVQGVAPKEVVAEKVVETVLTPVGGGTQDKKVWSPVSIDSYGREGGFGKNVKPREAFNETVVTTNVVEKPRPTSFFGSIVDAVTHAFDAPPPTKSDKTVTTTTVTKSVEVPAAVQDKTVTTDVKSTSTVEAIKKTVTFTEPVKSPVYSASYTQHITESDHVLSICEEELRTRQRDYATFPRADLLAWMNEIKGTAEMFVEMGGEVLQKEFEAQGLTGVGPHAQLVERAKKIMVDVEALRVKV